jgi:hypothetical protein
MIAEAEEKKRAKVEGEIARLTEKHDAEVAPLREERREDRERAV